MLELVDGGVHAFSVDPLDFGLSRALPEELTGGKPPVNAAHARAVLGGDHGPHRDIVLLNAGAALVVAGIAETLHDGIVAAAASIDTGRAATALDRLVDASNG